MPHAVLITEYMNSHYTMAQSFHWLLWTHVCHQSKAKVSNRGAGTAEAIKLIFLSSSIKDENLTKCKLKMCKTNVPQRGLWSVVSVWSWDWMKCYCETHHNTEPRLRRLCSGLISATEGSRRTLERLSWVYRQLWDRWNRSWKTLFNWSKASSAFDFA